MSTDKFEQHLQRQPLRAAPDAWRGPILAAARTPRRTEAQQAASTARMNLLREWLWPHPVAWGGLAACWFAIVTLHFAAAPTAAEIAQARTDARFAAAYSALLSHPAAASILAEPREAPFPTPSEPRSPDLGRCSRLPTSACA